ncbi:unnamed protein product, partial [marine sediment metagenome]
MKDYWKEYKQNERKERILKMKPIDAKPLLKIALKIGEKGTSEQKKLFRESIQESFAKSGEIMLMRALDEGVVSEKEWMDLRDKYGLEESDIGVLLQGYFNKKDGYIPRKEKIVVATTS